MEDSDEAPRTRTIAEQFDIVRTNTKGSHVMEYGEISISQQSIWNFQGNGKSMSNQAMFDMLFKTRFPETVAPVDHERIIRSEDAKLDYLYQKTIQNSDTRSNLDFMAELNHRLRVDSEFKHFERTLHLENVSSNHINFDCLRFLINDYSTNCATFDEFVMTKTLTFAKACNTDFTLDYMHEVLDNACAH